MKILNILFFLLLFIEICYIIADCISEYNDFKLCKKLYKFDLDLGEKDNE